MSNVIQQYCQDLCLNVQTAFRRVTAEMEGRSKVHFGSIRKSGGASPIEEVMRQNCIKLNNLEAVRQRLHDLYTTMDVDGILLTLEKHRNDQQQAAETESPTSASGLTGSIKVRAERESEERGGAVPNLRLPWPGLGPCTAPAGRAVGHVDQGVRPQRQVGPLRRRVCHQQRGGRRGRPRGASALGGECAPDRDRRLWARRGHHDHQVWYADHDAATCKHVAQPAWSDANAGPAPVVS